MTLPIYVKQWQNRTTGFYQTDEKTKEEKTFRHNNISQPFMVYINKLANQYPDEHIEARIALDDNSDYSLLRSDIKLIHYSDIIDELKNVQAEFLTDDEIKTLFKKLLWISKQV